MVDPALLGLAAGGVVLLLFGAVLSIYGVALLGVVVGGGGGYLVAPTIGNAVGMDGSGAVVAGVIVGALAGLIITYVLLSMAIAIMGFAVGTYVGMVVVGPMLDEGTLLTIAAGLGVGLAAGFLAMFLKRTTMVFATSFIGATLVSMQITLDDLSTAASDATVDPILVDATAPIFIGLFVLGVLFQFGLFKFGYVTKIVKLLPGGSVLRDGKDEEQASV